jgi:hypothetical protein
MSPSSISSAKTRAGLKIWSARSVIAFPFLEGIVRVKGPYVNVSCGGGVVEERKRAEKSRSSSIAQLQPIFFSINQTHIYCTSPPDNKLQFI